MAHGGPQQNGVETTGQIARVIDGDSLVLSDGREVFLSGIEAPKTSAKESLELVAHGQVAWPFAFQAAGVLKDLALGWTVTIAHERTRTDRYDRLVGQVYRRDGKWLQAEMIRRGLARVHGHRDGRACLAVLLAMENAARDAGLGIWSNPWYRVRTPDETVRDIDTFQIVEGIVLSSANVSGRIYLNFGTDYRHDFTVTISAKNARHFGWDEQAHEGLAGRTIRARGWISLYNGPSMEVTHPEQIEYPERIEYGEQGTGQPPNAAPTDPRCPAGL